MRRIAVAQNDSRVLAVLIWGRRDRTGLTRINHYFSDGRWLFDGDAYQLHSSENCLVVLNDGTTGVCAEYDLQRALEALEE